MVRRPTSRSRTGASPIEAWGSAVAPSPVDDPDHPGSLGVAISDAVRDASTEPTPHYSLGSVLNHVLLHQTVIGLEAKEQLRWPASRRPDVVIAPLRWWVQPRRDLVPVRAGRRLCASWPSSRSSGPTLTRGTFDYDFGDVAGLTPLIQMFTLGHDFVPPAIHAGGLRYHGDSPLISKLVPRRPNGSRGLPTGQGLRRRDPVRAHRGQDPGTRGGARDPGRDRRGPGGQGDRRGEGHPVQLHAATATSTSPAYDDYLNGRLPDEQG